MAGTKIDLAKKGAQEYWSRIPSGNKISFITFSDAVHTYPDAALDKVLPQVKATGMTALFSALTAAFDIAEKSGGQGWILLLTDGHPTDVTKPEPYSTMKVPPGFKMIEFGIGDDYREDILKALADASGGLLYHITDASKLPVLMQENAVSQVSGQNITVDFGSSDVRILNYPGPPVVINALENIAKIWGQITIPEGFKGDPLNIKVTYGDAVDGAKRTINSPVNIRPAKSDEEYQNSIRNNLLSEFRYYQGLEEYYKQLSGGHWKEATKTMGLLSANAQQTMRADLIESTKRLSEQHEQTLRLGGSSENTNRLMKEVASESTKKTRGK
ncbi:VWA domain-containing protein [Candidatus Bathyarchaeota archaeon]|nr:MAG: VWA domain-containing protein [Candidatus Bathyarchaeota archaeon]